MTQAPLQPRLPRNDIRRIVEKVPIVRQSWRAIQTMIGWGLVRLRKGEGGRQIVQMTRGEHEIYADGIVAEPQGFTSGIGPGARGVVFKPGGRGERVIVINPSKYQQRPRYVDNDAACVWTPYQSRLFLDDQGDVELGAGLSDYKETPDFLDEGAKVRLRGDGTLEVYAETEIKLRCQPDGGEGPSATVVMRPDGTLEVTTDADVSVTAAGSVKVSSEQSVEVEALGDVSVGAAGDVDVEAGGEVSVQAGGDVRLQPGPGKKVIAGNGGGGAVALEQLVTDALNTLIGQYNAHTHTVANAVAGVTANQVFPVVAGELAAKNLSAD